MKPAVEPSRCRNPAPSGRTAGRPSPSTGAALRLALWEVESALQCSIVGTCLSDRDLLAALSRNGLQPARDAQSYDIHSYCVRMTAHDCPLARSLNKILERRFAGAVRLMGQARTAEEMQALWQRLRDSGQIAGGYWAIMSHTHVPAALKTRVFGEVHMLSHLNGRGVSQLATRLAEVERKCADLEVRWRKSESARMALLAERNAASTALPSSTYTVDGSSQAQAAVSERAMKRLEDKLARCERALTVARARAREAEAALARREAAQSGQRRPPSDEAGAVTTCCTQVHRPAPSGAGNLKGSRILYLGGRAGIVPHLRTAAEGRVATFVHHDGGVEDSLHRIEELIESCDAVVCPIDCISHGACRMAKAICHRLKRRFLPIPTSSRSGFERALDQLALEPGHGSLAMRSER